MPFSHISAGSKILAPPAPARTPALTPEEWKLVLEALSAYQHHSAFRALYEKLAFTRIQS